LQATPPETGASAFSTSLAGHLSAGLLIKTAATASIPVIVLTQR
jgi:hypothetical protein